MFFLRRKYQFGKTQYNATLHYSATLCGKVAIYGNLQLQNMATFCLCIFEEMTILCFLWGLVLGMERCGYDDLHLHFLSWL
jgi:hypothetical protein